MNEVTHKLHDTAVGVPVVQRGGGDGTLDDVDDDAAAEQRDGTPLDKPSGQSEQVVHSVGVVPQTVLLLQQLKGRHAQSLEEEEHHQKPQSLP